MQDGEEFCDDMPQSGDFARIHLVIVPAERVCLV